MDRNRLLGVVVASALLVPGVSAAEGPWFYAVMGPGGSNEITVGQIGEVVYFELDSTTADFVWGNVRVDFDPAMLEFVSIEEYPAGPGFFTGWTPAPADPALGGGGVLYYYVCDEGHPCSSWGAEWVALYGQGLAGPVASHDDTQGIIRFYAMSEAGGLDGAAPLRIGFRIKQAGTVSITTSANDWEVFGFPVAAAAAAGPVASLQTAATEASGGYSWSLEDLRNRYTSTVGISTPAASLPVSIDIAPGDDRNCVNDDGRGTIPVAVLGSADLAVTAIDPATLSLEGMHPKTKPKLLAHYEDVNGDGYPDLVVQMEGVAGTFAQGQTTALLVGSLYGGTPIQGSDSICIVR
ncbi:MAG TPA: hypothetical protein VF912_11970 [Anaeromyxobacter sp.]